MYRYINNRDSIGRFTKRTRPVTPTQTRARFDAKVRRLPSGCHEWTGAKTSSGYGIFSLNGKPVTVHRWLYQQERGVLPQTLHIDHLCRNKLCVNVEHMEAVPQRVNTLRGTGFAARNARKTHCPHGHELDGIRRYKGRRNTRYCKTCARLRTARNKAKKLNGE